MADFKIFCVRAAPWRQALWAAGIWLLFTAAAVADPALKLFEKPGAFQGLTNPKIGSVQDEKILTPDSAVLGLVWKNEARAYPLRVLNEHRIINDTLKGPLLVTWDADSCSPRAFIAEHNGQRLTFKFQGWHLGVMVLRDQETGSLWSHLTGIAISGPARGSRMTTVPVFVTQLRIWRQMYPEGSILECDYKDRYGKEPPLVSPLSEEAKRSLSPADDRLPGDARVLGVSHEGQFKAYRVDQLTGLRVDHVAGEELAIFRDATGEIAVFQTRLGGRNLELGARTIDGVSRLVDQDESVFDLSGRAISGPLTGKQLTPVDAVETRWYAWAAYHPQTIIEGVPCAAGAYQPPVLLPLPRPKVLVRDDLRQKKETLREQRRAARRNREAGR